MSENRELTMDDYLAMLRRRLKVILIPALIAPIVAFLVSYELPPMYKAQSTVLVEGQKVPDTYVAPVITADFAERVQSLSEQIKSPSLLRIKLAEIGIKPEEMGKVINQIQSTTDVEPVLTPMSAAVAATPAAKKKPSASNEPVPGFQLSYTDNTPARAQAICNALTSLMLDQNQKSRADVATKTTEFLSGQLDAAKKTVDEQDAKLAAFKKQYMGQLPTDVDNNMRMLLSLNSQLDATTQTLSRAQQDKTYTDGMLAQQIAAWKASLNSTNPQTLQQQLSALQSQLMQLQARYTDDYPDVIKTKADIAEIQKKLNAINSADAATTTSAGTSSAGASEPPEVQQLRMQIHQYQEVIAQATQDQKKLQAAINVYQSRTAMSPTVEEQYKNLTRDNDTAQAFYKDLLAKKSEAELGTNMENQQEGEQMHIAAFADVPDSPSFPNRPLLAGAGFGVGLAFGALIAIFLEFSDKSIRTERDAAVSTDLPLLISLPWLTDEEEENSASANGNGHRRFWGRSEANEEHEKVGV
jgi:uncharacterized protein involved in exopolysaccharide biosynthesis